MKVVGSDESDAGPDASYDRAASAQQACGPTVDPSCSGPNQPAPPPEECTICEEPTPPPPPQFIDFAAGFPADYGFAVDFSALPEPVAFDATVVVEQITSGAVVTTSGF